MSRRFCLLFVSIMLSLQAGGQQLSDETFAAFKASYAAELVKDYGKAISELMSAYNENFYEINLRLGWLYYQKKEYEASQKYYRQAMKIRPKSIEAMFGFIYPAAAQTAWVEVYTTYQKILSIDPNNSVANYRIALMYYYRKEFGSAEKHLEKVIEHYPFDFDSILLMAQVKLAAGKLAESKSYYQRALLYNPSNDAIKAVMSKL